MRATARPMSSIGGLRRGAGAYRARGIRGADGIGGAWRAARVVVVLGAVGLAVLVGTGGSLDGVAMPNWRGWVPRWPSGAGGGAVTRPDGIRRSLELQAAGLLSGVDWGSAGAVGSRGRVVAARRLLQDCRRRGPACSCVAEADIAAGAIGSLGRGVDAVEDLGRFVDLCVAAGWSR